MNSSFFPPIPFETKRAALAVYGSGNHYLVIGEHVDALFEGTNMQFSSSSSQKQEYRMAILYLCTIFQHLESLPDHRAVDALQMRLDWKYALHASLNPIHMEASALCEFRKMVSADPATKQNLQKLLERMAAIPQVSLCNCIKHDADRVIHHVCTISRLANAWEAINNALQTLAISNPEWLRTYSLPYWYERYGHPEKSLNMRANLQELETFAEAVGIDGFYLLGVISSSNASDLAELPEISVLRKIWNEQYERDREKVIWKKGGCSSCSFSIRLQKTAWNIGLA